MEAVTSSLSCIVDSYTVSIHLEGEKIIVRVFSEVLFRLFVGEFTDKTLPEDLQFYGGCESVMYLLEECIQSKRKIALSDIGQLSFSCLIKMGKKDIPKEIAFPLKETHLDQTQKDRLKVEKLEKEVKLLKTQVAKLNEKMGSITAPKVDFEIDLDSEHIKKYVINDNSVKLIQEDENGNFSPLFSKSKIQNIQRYDFQIVNQSSGTCSIGIASADLKNELSIYEKNNSISISDGVIQLDNTSHDIQWSMNTGQFISMIVNLNNNIIEWELKRPFLKTLVKAEIPEIMRDKPIHAFVEIGDEAEIAFK